jgi:hypothetical protein
MSETIKIYKGSYKKQNITLRYETDTKGVFAPFVINDLAAVCVAVQNEKDKSILLFSIVTETDLPIYVDHLPLEIIDSAKGIVSFTIPKSNVNAYESKSFLTIEPKIFFADGQQTVVDQTRMSIEILNSLTKDIDLSV